MIPTPLFNPPPISRSLSHEPPTSPTSSSSSALVAEGSSGNGRLKRSSSDSDARKVAVAAAAAAAAASASAVSATVAYVAETSETVELHKEQDQHNAEQSLAQRTFYPSVLIAAAAAVPAAMAAAAAMCFPADSHSSSSAPPDTSTAMFASADVAHLPVSAESGVISPLSFDETPPQSVIARSFRIQTQPCHNSFTTSDCCSGHRRLC